METTEKKSGWSYECDLDVKARLPWHVHLALWLMVAGALFICAIEGFSLYVWLLENPEWLP